MAGKPDVGAFRLALGLFTVIPVRVGADPDRRTVRSAMLLAPVIGLGIGILAAAVLFFARVGLDASFTREPSGSSLASLASAAVAIVALELLSGGLHLDGLADTADGLAARGDKERTTAVMRDPAVGSIGAAAVMMVLLIEVTALALAVQRGHGTETIVTAVVAGRVAIVWGCTRRAARTDGLGAWVSRSVPVWGAVVVTGAALLVPLVLSAVDDDARVATTVFVVAALPAGLLVAAVATMPIRRRLGGISGDVLGAACQAATAGALVLAACAPS